MGTHSLHSLQLLYYFTLLYVLYTKSRTNFFFRQPFVPIFCVVCKFFSSLVTKDRYLDQYRSVDFPMAIFALLRLKCIIISKNCSNPLSIWGDIMCCNDIKDKKICLATYLYACLFSNKKHYYKACKSIIKHETWSFRHLYHGSEKNRKKIPF